MKKRLLITAVLAASVSGLTIATPVNQRQPVTKQQAKPVTRQAVILLRAKPSNTARIIGRFKLGTRLVAFYKKGDWLKAGDPKTGNVGWYNQNQVARALRSRLQAPEMAVKDYSIKIDKQGDKPAKITAYQDGKKLSDKQAKALYKQLRQQSKQQRRLWREQMNEVQGQINQMQRMDNNLFNGFPAPVIQPVIIIEKSVAKQPVAANKKASN